METDFINAAEKERRRGSVLKGQKEEEEMENTGFIQIGEVAMRDPLTRRHRTSIPLYAKETDCSMDATISDLAKMFAQLMKNDALERAGISARDRKSAKNGKSAQDAKNALYGKSAKDWEKLIGRRKARRREKRW